MPKAKKQAGTTENLKPVVVVSNRLPITFKMGQRGLEGQRSAGGLVSALEPVLQRRGGKWIGWAGTQLPRGQRLGRKSDAYEMQAVHLTDTEVNRYYHGFANRTLWPLFHSMPGHALFERKDWQAYSTVNQKFGDAVVKAAANADLVWLHDYHLMLTPNVVRKGLPHTRLAFFLHIPFPPYDLFRLLPWSRELLRGVLACDLIGFHVSNYTRNFLDCVELLLGARVDRKAGIVEYAGRTIRVGAFPIGIDFDYYHRLAEKVPKTEAAGAVVLGVDRLDYTKGIPERILAFERLLELYPEHLEKVVFLQLAVPSRSAVAEYQDLKRQIDELVGRVNGRFSTAGWSPIRYLYQSLSSEKLVAMYRDAQVALVTPGCDGMNLVAKEYVACQVDDPGVLVLSSLAGASETMHEALLVNPYNLDGTAHALHRALTMDEAERRSRITALRRREKQRNVTSWVDSFLQAVPQQQRRLTELTVVDFESWLGAFLDQKQLALFVGYDGVLAEYAADSKSAKPTAGTRRALRACAKREDTDVAVVAGRTVEDLKGQVRLRGVSYSGNHGLEIVDPKRGLYRHEDVAYYEPLIAKLAKNLRKLKRQGAEIEDKGPTLTLHYRDALPKHHESIASRARQEISAAGFQPRDVHLAVEARLPIAWGGGHAALQIVRDRFGPSWSERVRIVYVGNEHAEDVFQMLSGLGITVRVGGDGTLSAASRELGGVADVQALLTWLANR